MPLLLYLQYCGKTDLCKNDLMAFSIAILTALFALLIPFKGFIGLVSVHPPLENQSAVWFYDICERLKQQNEPLPFVQENRHINIQRKS